MTANTQPILLVEEEESGEPRVSPELVFSLGQGRGQALRPLLEQAQHLLWGKHEQHRDRGDELGILVPRLEQHLLEPLVSR